MKNIKHLLIGILGFASLILGITGCDENRNKATLGGTQDTSSVNKAGGPAIRDTATINKDRRDSAATKKGNTSKGNADPSGHTNTTPVRK